MPKDYKNIQKFGHGNTPYDRNDGRRFIRENSREKDYSPQRWIADARDQKYQKFKEIDSLHKETKENLLNFSENVQKFSKIAKKVKTDFHRSLDEYERLADIKKDVEEFYKTIRSGYADFYKSWRQFPDADRNEL